MITKRLAHQVEQQMKFEKFSCFFIDFLRYSFGRIKVISTVTEREYTPNITWQICFACQSIGFHMTRGFTERYFLTGYSYILENHFYFVNAPSHCFKLSLSDYFVINSSVKVFSPPYEGPSTQILRTSSLCTFIIYRKKGISFVAKFFSKYFLGQR